MLFRHQVVENRYTQLEEKIKKDLAETLQKKGVNISKILINLKAENVNIQVCISKE